MSDLIAYLRQFPEILQLCGVLGSILYVGGFALVQTGRICGNGPYYSVNQLIAATLVILSLIGAFNLGAFLIQVGFLTFGSFGLARRYWLRRRGMFPAGTGLIRTVSNVPTAPASQGDWPMTCDSENRRRGRAGGRPARPYLVSSGRAL